MFSTSERINSRTGKCKVGRFSYLKQLKEEFLATVDKEAKHQVIANLANFAYDPINYEHLRSLCIIDLFLEQLCEDDETMVRFALGGLCNLALDGENKEYINNSGGIIQISRCLQASCTATLMYATTTLMFLMTVKHKAEITSDANIARMLELSSHPDKRVQNLAVIFLEDYCMGDQIHKVCSSINSDTNALSSQQGTSSSSTSLC